MNKIYYYENLDTSQIQQRIYMHTKANGSLQIATLQRDFTSIMVTIEYLQFFNCCFKINILLIGFAYVFLLCVKVLSMNKHTHSGVS
jgi:hypothetical protein